VRLLLIDTDIFVLLAAAGLIERVASLLGFKPEDLRRLPAVEFQLSRGKKFKEKFPSNVRASAIAVAQKIAPLTERPASDAMLQQLNVDDIDEGEAVMFALLAENPSWLLTTGDRRSLVALGTQPDLSTARNSLAGRLVCIETVLRLLVINDGVEQIAKAFAPVRECDTKLRVIFSEANATNRESCLAGIDSYLTNLRTAVGETLLYREPSQNTSEDTAS
jgi:hypothetical protein